MSLGSVRREPLCAPATWENSRENTIASFFSSSLSGENADSGRVLSPSPFPPSQLWLRFPFSVHDVALLPLSSLSTNCSTLRSFRREELF